MTDTAPVNATEFVRNFGRYQHEAIRSKVIVITSHQRVVGGYLSADELENYRRLKARDREVLLTRELDDETLAQIEAAEYGVVPV